MARRGPRAEEKPGVPAWIVSFSDMVTLLLAFFVLLQSFAHVQDPELFFIGQGSFKRAIAGMGLPSWLFGREDKPKRDYINVKHPSDEGPPSDPRSRNIDADDEKIRNIFDDLKKNMNTSSQDTVQVPIRVELTPIRFPAGAAGLDDRARTYLKQLAFDLRQTLIDPD
ncbi:MAG: hypothetical protein J7M21_00280, partial [Planctomycetes bacterium]|nr:hypothetical protein [Planctomycetota bacterium]